jgi:hypothetical protein
MHQPKHSPPFAHDPLLLPFHQQSATRTNSQLDLRLGGAQETRQG